MKPENIKILRNGRLTIPAKIWKRLGLKPGDAVKVFDYDGAIHVIPSSKNPVKAATGILPQRPALSKKLLKGGARERRAPDFKIPTYQADSKELLNPLRGTVLEYKHPTKPVGVKDWTALE